MGDSSDWISGLNKGYFEPFGIFFRKIIIFQAKIKIFFSLIILVPKPPETHFRQNL